MTDVTVYFSSCHIMNPALLSHQLVAIVACFASLFLGTTITVV